MPQKPLRDIRGFASPAQVARALNAALRETNKRHAMLIHKPHVRKRHRHAARVVESVGRTRAHRCTRIERDDEREIFLLEKHFEEEAIEAPEDVPIDEAQIVAVDVRAEVGELHALTASA